MSINQPDSITAQSAGTDVGLRPIFNFIAGTNVSFGIVDDPTNNRVNITVNASASGTISGSGTDNRIVRWDGTSNVQDSLVTLTDTGIIQNAYLDDSVAFIKNGDPTCQVYFDLAGSTTGFTSVFDFNNTAARTYTFQDASGTLAFLSDLSAYAPVGEAYVTIGNTAGLTAERRLLGTTNQVTITDNGANSSVVLSLPQNIHTAATPTFQSVILTDIDTGAVPFANGSNQLIDNPTKFFWSNTYETLCLGNTQAQQNIDGVNETSRLSLESVGSGNEMDAFIHRHSATSTFKSDLALARSRGSSASPSAIQVADYIGAIDFFGHDGTQWRYAAQIRSEIDSGTVSTSSMPGLIRFLVTPNGSTTLAEAMRINQSKLVTMADGLTIAGTFTTPLASGALYSNSGVVTSEPNLDVTRGGTGLGTLTANNLIVGAGTSDVTFIAPGTSGNVLQSNGTTWASTSLSSAGIAPNNLTYMTISNESATLANSRRIAVNATNLVGTDGGPGSAYTINTIQNIDTSATPTFQRVITTGSTNQRFFQGDGTLDGSSGTEIGYQFDFTMNQSGTATAIGLKVNATDTASPNLFYLMDLQKGGVSKFLVDENGNLTSAGTLTATGATLSGLTTGQIVFPTSGTLTGDASLFWDNTNKRFGVGTSTPSYPFDLQGTLTSTSGNDAVEFITAQTNPSSASTAAHRALDAIITYNTSSTNNLTTLAAGRFLSINNNSAGGTLTTIQGLALQTIVGPVLGAASGTAYAANILGAVFQSIQNSTTASVTATNYAGQFSADHRGSNTVTSNAAGIFTVSMTNASGTMTAGYGSWIRFSTVFGNALTAGTITNIYGLNIEGFPSGAATFTNSPHQILLQAGSTVARAIRQQGASNYSTFQGYVGIGSDTAPSSSYALTVTGNCSFSSTIFNFSTLTSLTFQDALARSRLYMDATSTTISTTPVSIAPTANIGTGISLTTTTPAHTGLTAEQYELLIDMSSTKTWNGSLSIPTQRHLYIRAPVVNAPVTTTIDQIATVAISGVPTISGGGSVNITESIGFLMEAVSIPSNIATGIGFSISAPTTGGASTVACGRFLGGNVGINSMSPDTWLDIKVTSITSTLNNVVCLDSTTRYTGFYVGGSALASMPGSGVSSFALFDFGLAPTSSYSQNNQGHQIFFELKNANNFTGTLVGSTTSMKVNTSGGTTTTAIALDGLFTTVSGSTGAVTTGVAGRLRMTVNGTGTVTTAVGLDMTYSSANVAVTTTTGHYIRLQNPSKGAAATTTNWDSILIEDGTMTVGTRYCAIRVLGSTHHNRIVPKTKFGSDATPTRMVDINGGLAINPGTAVSLTADNQVVTVGDRSYFQISSNNATATNRTFVLTQSTTAGHVLVLEWTGTNAGELVDDSAQNGGGNHRLNGTWTPTQYDTITLISNGTDWVELARSAN